MTLVQDITARRRAQDELLESEERYRTLVSHTPMGIVVHALGPVLFVNSANALRQMKTANWARGLTSATA